MCKHKNIFTLCGIGALILTLVLTGCKQNPDEPPPVTNDITVTFDSSGGSTVDSQTVKVGSTLTEPDAPTRADHTFVGWFNGDERWYFNTGAVIAPMTLTAKWAANNASDLFTVTFNTDGGTAIPPIKVIKGEIIDLSAFITTREGYAFNGWIFVGSGGGQDIEVSATVNSDMEFIAVWSILVKPGNGGAMQEAGEDDIVSPFMLEKEGGIDPSQNATDNLRNSVIGVQVDGPTTASSFSGTAWQENGNIRVLGNTANEGITTGVDGTTDAPLVDSNGIFEFYLHDTKDYDNANTDRQRIEIKGSTSYSSQNDKNIKGKEDDIITYYWKFKLPADLVRVQPAGFFHIFQIKATTGPEAGAPVVSFTVTGENLLFRHTTIGAHMDTTQIITSIPITSVLGKWVAAECTIHYRDDSRSNDSTTNGYIYVKLTDLEADTVLMEGAKNSDMWRRPEATDAGGQWYETDLDASPSNHMRPKWGLYRSINAPVVSEASMQWADCVMVKRDKATYRFPNGYDPNTAGGIPNRDSSEYWTGGTYNETDQLYPFDYVTGGDEGSWKTLTKTSMSHSAGIANIFTKGNSSRWQFPDTSISEGGSWDSATETAVDIDKVVTAKIPSWIAVDLGQSRKINEIELGWGGGNDPRRIGSCYIAVTNDDAAWNDLKTRTSGSFIGAVNSDETTLDPLGVHKTDRRYYDTSFVDPYQHQDKWKKFVDIPVTYFSGNDGRGQPVSFSQNNIFSKKTGIGLAEGVEEVEGRYVILYMDAWPYQINNRVDPLVFDVRNRTSNKLYTFLIKYNRALDVELGTGDGGDL